MNNDANNADAKTVLAMARKAYRDSSDDRTSIEYILAAGKQLGFDSSSDAVHDAIRAFFSRDGSFDGAIISLES